MDDLQYEAQNYQNRQRVKMARGALWLTVPLSRGAQTDRICDKRIDNTAATRSSTGSAGTWRTLETSYARAPHFARYAPALREVYDRPWSSLVELDLHLLALACAGSASQRRSSGPPSSAWPATRPTA